MEKLIRIEAPHFVAGIVIDWKNMVVDAAPILKWMIGREVNDCLQLFWKERLSGDFSHHAPLTERLRPPVDKHRIVTAPYRDCPTSVTRITLGCGGDL
jgi:hypothetical protein